MFGNYINGEWISTGATFENRNPATGEVVGTFVKGTAADIDAAAAAASAAFPGWSATSGPARGNILYKAADILDENFLRLQDELAGTENRIAVERRKYNETLQGYNTAIQLFPNNIVAGMSGFTRNDAYFKTEPGARTNPKVAF